MDSNELKFIEEIRNGKKDFTILYNKYYKYAVSVLSKKGASVDEINDIYQDAMIVIFNKISSPEFILSSKLSTYLYSILLNLWYKELEKKSKFVDVNTSFMIDSGDEINYNNYAVMTSKNMIHEDVYNEDDLKVALFKKLIEKLNYKEQHIIKLILDGMNSKEIMEEMGFSNTDVVKTLKSRAVKNLRSQIEQLKHTQKDNPIFKVVHRDEDEMEKLFNIKPSLKKVDYEDKIVQEIIIETTQKDDIEIDEINIEPIQKNEIEVDETVSSIKEEIKSDSKFKSFLSFFNKLLK